MRSSELAAGNGGREVIAEAVRLEFGRAIEREWSFLRALGYQPADVAEVWTEALGSHLTGGYTNAAANRAVRVSYLPGDDATRPVATTDVSLIVPDPVDEFDYTTLHTMGVCVTQLSTAADFAAGFSHHLRDAARILGDQFGEVLAGRAWRPTTWTGAA